MLVEGKKSLVVSLDLSESTKHHGNSRLMLKNEST
jgi:hypothetical protein